MEPNSIQFLFYHLTIKLFSSSLNPSLVAKGRNLPFFPKEHVTITQEPNSICRSCGGLLANEKQDKNASNDK